MISIISISGGKDSTALWLWARRTGLAPRVIVFCDTGWEARETYEYLDVLQERLGEEIVRVRGPETFEERTRRSGTFPSRRRQWCTDELKRRPFAAWLDGYRDQTSDEVQVLIGIRRAESEARANVAEREWSDDYDCDVWRPLIAWSLEQVIAEHHAAGIPLNPLYQLGAERVGCWPCIYGGKTEIRLVADHDPERIERIAAIERDIGQTMFAEEPRRVAGQRQPLRRLPIADAVTWSRTSHGGRELTLFAPPSGCARWGLCEHPGKDKP